jgi:hypothetical protein
MRTAPPPHYLAFRIVLVMVVGAVLAGAVWTVRDPSVLVPLLFFLGLG